MMKQYSDQFIRISSQQTEQIIQQLWHSDLFPEGVTPHVSAILRPEKPLDSESDSHCVVESTTQYTVALSI